MCRWLYTPVHYCCFAGGAVLLCLPPKWLETHYWECKYNLVSHEWLELLEQNLVDRCESFCCLWYMCITASSEINMALATKKQLGISQMIRMCRVHSMLEKSMKMLEFGIKTSRPLKVLENRCGAWKYLKILEKSLNLNLANFEILLLSLRYWWVQYSTLQCHIAV